MSGLKATVLTVSGIALWLAPPFLLSRKVPLHNLTTGAALIAGFACCLEARKLALRVAKEEEFEAMKEAAINADVVDEIATSAYVSEQQRRQEAEALLNAGSERSKTIELLERALALDSDEPGEPEPERSEERSLANSSAAPDEPEPEPEPERSSGDLTPEEQVLAERIMNLRVRGWGKAKIILELWGATKGGSPRYKAAEAEYKRLVGE